MTSQFQVCQWYREDSESRWWILIPHTEKKPVVWKYKKVQSSLKMQVIDRILELMSLFMKLKQQPLGPDTEAMNILFLWK